LLGYPGTTFSGSFSFLFFLPQLLTSFIHRDTAPAPSFPPSLFLPGSCSREGSSFLHCQFFLYFAGQVSSVYIQVNCPICFPSPYLISMWVRGCSSFPRFSDAFFFFRVFSTSASSRHHPLIGFVFFSFFAEIQRQSDSSRLFFFGACRPLSFPPFFFIFSSWRITLQSLLVLSASQTLCLPSVLAFFFFPPLFLLPMFSDVESNTIDCAFLPSLFPRGFLDFMHW